MGRARVLVAGRPIDLSDVPFDAFVERHGRFIELLSEHFDVCLLGLRDAGDSTVVSGRWSALPYREVTIERAESSRRRRLLDAVHAGRDANIDPWECDLAGAAASLDPQAVITLGPWLSREYRALHERYRSVHLFEEDLSRMRELAPQSPQAQVLRRLLVTFESRSTRQPITACYLARQEEHGVRRRHPTAEAVYLPYTLDPQSWPIAPGPVSGSGVVVVGNLSQFRNAEGLAEMLEIVSGLAHHPLHGVRVVSDAGLHPCLKSHVRSGLLRHLHGHDVATCYQSAAIALVPAKRLTGLKTTVLQAWAMGCPVVGFSATAHSVGATATSMRSGDTAAQVLGHIEDLMQFPQQRTESALAGFDMLRNHFDDQRVQHDFLAVVRRALSTQQPALHPTSSRS